MGSLLKQWIEQVWAAGDGDLRHSPLCAASGIGLTPDGLPATLEPARLLMRSHENEAVVDAANVVGIALPHYAAVTTCSGTDLEAASLDEADDYWIDHLVVMADGTQQGRYRRVTAFAGGHLTLAAACPADPSPADTFWMLPLRVPDMPWIEHGDGAADTFYYYATAVLSGGGLVSVLSKPVRVEFDAAHAIRGPLPNAVRFLDAEAIAGGKFRLRWRYPSVGGGAWPADFQVFDDAGTGTIDYETPLTDSNTGLAYVPFVGPGRVYRFTTGVYDDGVERKFDVLARNADEARHAGAGPVTLAATAMAVGPAGIPGVEARAVEDLRR
ncbi:MAG TPA: hypothetical protein VM243_02305 [Phycisphaerae bacterium]|nr:hypothetical protein [Phycisphaerae bacterium]